MKKSPPFILSTLFFLSFCATPSQDLKIEANEAKITIEGVKVKVDLNGPEFAGCFEKEDSRACEGCVDKEVWVDLAVDESGNLSLLQESDDQAAIPAEDWGCVADKLEKMLERSMESLFKGGNL